MYQQLALLVAFKKGIIGV